jgi:hypothetical protein
MNKGLEARLDEILRTLENREAALRAVPIKPLKEIARDRSEWRCLVKRRLKSKTSERSNA